VVGLVHFQKFSLSLRRSLLVDLAGTESRLSATREPESNFLEARIMILKLLKLNAKGVQLAFFAGSALGSALGATAGIGIGLGLGAMLGVLYAPKSGVETRQQLKQNMSEAMEEAMTQGELIKEKATNACSAIQNKIAAAREAA
jgi:gas vesicle protein